MVAAMKRRGCGCEGLGWLWVVFVCLLAPTALVAVVDAATSVPSPAHLLHFDAAAPVRLPDGGVIVLPAGSEIGACGVDPLRYDANARMTRVPQPCIDEQVFADGFEAR